MRLLSRFPRGRYRPGMVNAQRQCYPGSPTSPGSPLPRSPCSSGLPRRRHTQPHVVNAQRQCCSESPTFLEEFDAQVAMLCKKNRVQRPGWLQLLEATLAMSLMTSDRAGQTPSLHQPGNLVFRKQPKAHGYQRNMHSMQTRASRSHLSHSQPLPVCTSQTHRTYTDHASANPEESSVPESGRDRECSARMPGCEEADAPLPALPCGPLGDPGSISGAKGNCWL